MFASRDIRAIARRSALSVLPAGCAATDTAGDLRGLENDRINDADVKLQVGGYRLSSEHGSDRDDVRYYWDNDREECLRLTVKDDRVDGVEKAYASLSEQLAGGSRGGDVRYVEAAVAAGVRKQEGRDRKDAFRDIQGTGYVSVDN